ncbi:hypothetical protein [Streptomyces sp. b94]|uniref:hypothetical protein n=1 Tax=Streptomyces sp. b94 TaxID=1827634 RepID=UPI00117DC14F|nr:hypothetical protein [Streptomyces sp. b94]
MPPPAPVRHPACLHAFGTPPLPARHCTRRPACLYASGPPPLPARHRARRPACLYASAPPRPCLPPSGCLLYTSRCV